jgi:hypothetical protein
MSEQAAPGPGAEGEPPPSVRMFDLLYGFEVSQALFVAVKLDLATLLQAGPRSVEDLAAASGAQAGPLRRLLRVLASLGVFATVGPGTFALTPLGGTLASGTPGSMREVALMCMDLNYGSFGKLLDTLTTGTAGSEIYLGRQLFEWLADHPVEQGQFTGAMRNLAESLALRALSAYRLPAGDVVADIGGADGTILSFLLAGDPARRGILFDRPQVVPAASRLLAGRGLADRVSIVAGDFFEAVPAADVYVMSKILHDWDDESCRRLLASIATAARPGARLVVLEQVVPEGDQPHMSKLLDLTMLVMTGGKERTAAEFEELFASAGFRLDQIIQTPTPLPILEATLTQT